MNPKLADFGLSVIHGAGVTTIGSRSGEGGTIRFMAPELLIGEEAPASFAGDIYAFGCLCLEVCVVSPNHSWARTDLGPSCLSFTPEDRPFQTSSPMPK